MNGERLGWLTFDPVTRSFSLDIAPEALPFLIGHATKGIVDLDRETDIRSEGGRVGGKRLALKTPVPDGTVIVKYKQRYGTGMVRDGSVKVRELIPVVPRTLPDPGWDVAVEKNRYHLKNLERNAIRAIKQHLSRPPDRKRLVLRGKGQHGGPPHRPEGRCDKGVLYRHGHRVSRDYRVCPLAGCGR